MTWRSAANRICISFALPYGHVTVVIVHPPANQLVVPTRAPGQKCPPASTPYRPLGYAIYVDGPARGKGALHGAAGALERYYRTNVASSAAAAGEGGPQQRQRQMVVVHGHT
jgi:hypothetical protein